MRNTSATAQKPFRLSVAEQNVLDDHIREDTIEDREISNYLAADKVDFELPVFWSAVPQGIDGNVRHATYTAVRTNVPINFTSDGYELQPKRDWQEIKLLVCCTCYNEDWSNFHSTIIGVMKNIETLCSVHGENAWRSVYVVFILDGRLKANEGALKFLASQLGLFNKNVMMLFGLGKGDQVNLHMFEHTAQLQTYMNLLASPLMIYAHSEEGIGIRCKCMTGSAENKCWYRKVQSKLRWLPPCQMNLTIKEKNAGKLDSHLWFFNAYAEQLEPKYCFMIDVGTRPKKKALVRLYEEMEFNGHIGGCCGEITTKDVDLANFIAAAQYFEYKVSHVLDKSLESVFGFNSVLPGAFSGYRYCAIRNHKGEGPLVEYFRSISSSMGELGPFKGNMYLAEDRILCYELLSRDRCKWTLSYVKDAVAITDIPTDLISLLKQRRRWLNGSFFALLYTLVNFNRLWTKSYHSPLRKLGLSILFLYYGVQAMVTFVLPANLYLFYYFIVQITFAPVYWLVEKFLVGLYLITLLINLLMGLGNTPTGMSTVYKISAWIQAILSICTIALTGYYFLDADLYIKVAGVAGFTFYFLAAFLHGQFFLPLTSLQYFAMVPIFVNLFAVYSFCNTHDLSWGTKGLTQERAIEVKDTKEDLKARMGMSPSEIKYAVKQKERKERHLNKLADQRRADQNYFKAFRTYLLVAWILVNAVLVIVVSRSFADANGLELQKSYFLAVFALVIFFNGVRLLGSIFYLSSYVLGCRKWRRKKAALRGSGKGPRDRRGKDEYRDRPISAVSQSPGHPFALQA